MKFSRALTIKTRDGRDRVKRTLAATNRRSGAVRLDVEAMELRSLLSITLDPTFGLGGQVVLGPPIGAINPIPEAITLQNGEILQLSTDLSDLILTRYLADGSVDTSFGSDGTVFVQTQLTFEKTYQYEGGVGYEPLFGTTSVLVNRHGGLDIAAVGVRTLPGGPTGLSLEVVQLKADGSLDSKFGKHGVTYVEVAGKSLAGASPASLAFDPHGRLVVATQVNGVDDPTVAVARLEANGRVDKTFHRTGSTTISLPTHLAGYGLYLLEGVVVQPNSKIVISGATVFGVNTVVVRLHANGTLDKTFDHTGILAFSVDYGGSGSVDFPSAVALDGNNLVISGWTTAFSAIGDSNPTPAGEALFVAELKPNGTLDTSFGGTGEVEVSFTQLGLTAPANLGAVNVLGDGSIVVGGDGYQQGTDAEPAVVLATFSPNGSVTGFQTVSVGDNGPNFFGNIGAALVAQQDGKLIYWSDGFAVRFEA